MNERLMKIVTGRIRLTMVATSSSAVALFGLSACVMQSTYDAAVQEGLTTRTELAQALQEQAALTRQVSELEMRNADAVREAEAAVAVLQQTQAEADQERRQIEQRVSKLKQKVAQAAKQQHALQYEMTVAKENGAALQELIDVYQRKMRDGSLASANEPAVHKPFDPSTIPLAQDLPLPPAPAVTPPQPAPQPASVPPPVAAPVKHTAPPAEEGWFDSIKNWLVSVWRSVFS
jgi:hypothetical protein